VSHTGQRRKFVTACIRSVDRCGSGNRIQWDHTIHNPAGSHNRRSDSRHRLHPACHKSRKHTGRCPTSIGQWDWRKCTRRDSRNRCPGIHRRPEGLDTFSGRKARRLLTLPSFQSLWAHRKLVPTQRRAGRRASEIDPSWKLPAHLRHQSRKPPNPPQRRTGRVEPVSPRRATRTPRRECQMDLGTKTQSSMRRIWQKYPRRPYPWRTPPRLRRPGHGF
jgi:hypothetical protein